MTEIRYATVKDLGFILQELKVFSAFFATRIPLFPEDETHAGLVIKNMIENHLFLISLSNGEPSGFISGWLTPHPFNPGITQLTETFWWVALPFRNTSAGAKLLDAFIAWGKENATWITMTLEADSPVSSYPLLRRGFKLKETSYLMECE